MVGTTNRSMAAMSGAWLRRKMHQPWLTNGDRLFLVQLYRWFPSVLHSGFSALICRINARRSAAIFGRPPREQDFQRQYRRKPARCQRTRVSGRMIVMALRTDGNHRYSWTKNKRSPFVSRTRPRTLTDLPAPRLGDSLRADLRESFIVENRPGPAANIATASVARASNDGYTLLLSTNSNSMNVSLFKDLLFDLVRDLQPIAMIAVPRSAPTPAVDPGGRPPEQNRT